MNTKRFLMLLFVIPFMLGSSSSCLDAGSKTDRAETAAVERQQEHYATTQPVPFFEHSLARDVYIQIYKATNMAPSTFTIIESVTGVTKFSCPSVGYALPADVSLTNPVKGDYIANGGTIVTDQAEPNGLFSSKNTDGTWVLCVMSGGEIAPVYTEHKVSVFPFYVEGLDGGQWTQQAGSVPSTTVTLPNR